MASNTNANARAAQRLQLLLIQPRRTPSPRHRPQRIDATFIEHPLARLYGLPCHCHGLRGCLVRQQHPTSPHSPPYRLVQSLAHAPHPILAKHRYNARARQRL
jgi:hypothetical protein